MYQRVVDSSLHPQVSKCLKLTSIAHYHRDETELALSAAAKKLVVSISLNGFDSPEVLDAHANLADISLGAGRVPEGVRHEVSRSCRARVDGETTSAGARAGRFG